MMITLISLDSYELFKTIAAVIFLLDAIFFFQWFSRMFGPDYQKVNFVKTNSQAKVLWCIWVASTLSIIFDFIPVLGLLILAVIFRYYYIHARPTNLFRGGGAVGIFPALIAMYLFISELMITARIDWATVQIILYIMVFHIGLTIFDAGLYKTLNGYLRNDGFQYALMNPFWSYWCNTNIVNTINANIWRLINPFMAIAQVVIGILMLFPPTQAYGAIHLGLGFFVLGIFLKLANLPILIGSIVFLFVDSRFQPTSDVVELFSWLQNVDDEVLMFSLIYLSFLTVGQILVWLNFYLSIYLPQILQNTLDRINFYLPILVWRVFSADVVNIYSLVYEVDSDGNKRLLNRWDFMTDYGENVVDRIRFFNVAESCVMSSIFNSVRYNDKNLPIAKERLLQFSNTLKPQLYSSENDILFEVFRLTRNTDSEKIERIKISDWVVNLKTARSERVWNSSSSSDLISGFLRPFGGFGKYHA
ncbi:hypothetical protein N9L40_01275 [Rhodobacteraceae bacterium]|nr:hypothetical protein [Paracoccaceae bacterium]